MSKEVKKNLKNTRRNGMYNLGGKFYVSVTTALDVIDKPALRYWFGKEVYYALIKNPELDEKAALAAPYKTTKKAQDRGTTVHSMVEAYKNGVKLDTTSVPPELLGYVQAFYKFVDDIKPVIKAQEKTVFSKKHGYAGTLDLLLGLDRGDYVIDVKTSKEIYASAFIQGSAYQNALQEEGLTINGIGVLLLKPDGDYKFETRENTKRLFKSFLACKYLWEGLNENMLEKIGYFDTPINSTEAKPKGGDNDDK